MNYIPRRGCFVIGVVLLGSAVWAADFDAHLPPTLAELEKRAPGENVFPNLNPAFHEDVLRLIEANTLTTGDEFGRAAKIASGPMHEYRDGRVEYELLLSAIAKGNHEAETMLCLSWDQFLLSIGRPLRFDSSGFFAQSLDPERYVVDRAPRAIQAVYGNPAEARATAARHPSNREVQQLVDADQAVRKKWAQLTEKELHDVRGEDSLRATRIRLIIATGELYTAADFANASLVLQHSSSFAGYELAHELAVCSLLLGDRGLGRWLVAATYDRMLESVGHDQRFGTQGRAMTMASNAKPQLSRTDVSGICDNERLALGCPTLAAKRADFYTSKPK